MDQSPEGDANKAAKICFEGNSPDAVIVILEVLRRDQHRGGYLALAHYRGVAWGGLVQVSGPYAERVVEVELKRNKESA